MKKATLIAAFFMLLMGSLSTPVAAQDCGSNWGDCCEWSMFDGQVKVGADWLYWETRQDNMGLASLSNASVIAANPNSLDLRVVEPKFKYTSGFRVNLGYELPCNCWEVNVIYTYMPTNSSSRHLFASTEDEIYIIPGNGLTEAVSSIGAEDVLSFHQKWDLTINNIDVDFARTITFNECISIRPHAGFRSLWYSEKQSVFVTVDPSATFNPNPLLPEFSNYDAVAKNKFTGYGVEAGLWGCWQVGCGFSIIGHFGGSVLYSKFDICSFANETLVTSSTVGEVTTPVITEIGTIAAHDCQKTATPTIDYFLGLQYADQMCDMSFAIRCGWEQHVIFNTNRISHNGNLSTQGLTLAFEVGF